MPKLNIKKNFQDSIKKDRLIEYAQSAVVAPFSAFAPSAMGLSGWTAFAVGYGLPLLAGMAMGWKGMVTGAVSMMTGHLCYEYGDQLFDQGIWDLDGNTKTGVSDQLASALPPGATIKYLNGEPVVAYPSMGDYIKAGEPSPMGDYILAGEPSPLDDEIGTIFANEDIYDERF